MLRKLKECPVGGENSEVLMLGLLAYEALVVKKGTQEGGREGRRREREGETTNSTSCGFSTGPAS